MTSERISGERAGDGRAEAESKEAERAEAEPKDAGPQGAERAEAGSTQAGSTQADSTQADSTQADRMEVQRMIPAAPAAIFRVLTDPQGHVAIDSAGMLMDATGEPVRAVGDTFVVHMDREALNDFPLGKYDVTVRITTFVPDREIAWTVEGVIRPAIGHVYGYRLEPSDGGTLVTSYYDWSAIDEKWRESGIFPVIPETALRATLGILARTVTHGYVSPLAG
jgi:hypothetical protein